MVRHKAEFLRSQGPQCPCDPQSPGLRWLALGVTRSSYTSDACLISLPQARTGGKSIGGPYHPEKQKSPFLKFKSLLEAIIHRKATFAAMGVEDAPKSENSVYRECARLLTVGRGLFEVTLDPTTHKLCLPRGQAKDLHQARLRLHD